MNLSIKTPRFGSLGPPTGPRRTWTPLSPARKQEVNKMLDNLICTVRLSEAPQAGKKGFKITMGPNASEFNVILKGDTTFVATRSDGEVVIDMFHNTWNFGNLSVGYTNKSKPEQNFVEWDGITDKGREFSAKLLSLVKPGPKSPEFDI